MWRCVHKKCPKIFAKYPHTHTRSRARAQTNKLLTVFCHRPVLVLVCKSNFWTALAVGVQLFCSPNGLLQVFHPGLDHFFCFVRRANRNQQPAKTTNTNNQKTISLCGSACLCVPHSPWIIEWLESVANRFSRVWNILAPQLELLPALTRFTFRCSVCVYETWGAVVRRCHVERQRQRRQQQQQQQRCQIIFGGKSN